MTKRDGERAEFETILATAHRLADLSRPAVLKPFRRPLDVENKAGAGAFDPVTKADRAAERVLVKALAQSFPDHAVLGEEYGRREGASPFCWVLDPIDGTRAYIMGSPMWGTLIGVLKDGVPYCGVVDLPATGERYFSTLNGASMTNREGSARRIRTRPCSSLGNAILTSTHPDLFEGKKRIEKFAGIKARARMTRYGGDCWNYALLAAGFVDLVVESGLKSYDIVALVPIIERAGGVVTTWTGGAPTDGGDIVASGDRQLHEQVLKLLA